MWDGKLPEVQDASSSSTCKQIHKSGIPQMLSGVELSPAQLEYLEHVAHPLWAEMMQDTASMLPERLAAFLIQWLMKYLNVPRSLADPVLSWLNTPRLPQPPAQGDIAPERPQAESPLKPKQGALLRSIRRSQTLPNLATPTLQEPPNPVQSLTEGESLKDVPKDSQKPKEDNEDADQDEDDEHDDSETEATPRNSEKLKCALYNSENEDKARQYNSESEDKAPQPKRTVRSSLINRASSTQSGLSEPAQRRPKRIVSISAMNPEVALAQKEASAEAALKGRSSKLVLADTEKMSGSRFKMRQRNRHVSIFTPPPEINHTDKVALVKTVPLFKNLCDEDIEELVSYSQVRTFDADQDIVRHGEAHKELHMIHSGEVRVSVPILQGTLKHGQCFGEHALTKAHLKSVTTMSAQGTENSRVVTLAISHADAHSAGILAKVKSRRDGMATVIQRTPSAAKRGVHHANSTTFRSTLSQSKMLDDGKKTHEDKQLIMKAVKANTHFSDWLCLTDDQYNMIVDMAKLRSFESGQNVITAGERGDTFYIVNDGLLEVLTRDASQLGALRIGDSFGELALLYNSPRKATVRAVRNCQLWTLTRDQFQHIMHQKSVSRIAEYKGLIDTVPLLADHLTEGDKETLADAMEEVFHVKDEVIVTQGDQGNSFYIIFNGVCEVLVDGIAQDLLQAGAYFGERALLYHEPRAATVVCASETTTLMKLDSHSFSILLRDAFASLSRKGSSIETSDIAGFAENSTGRHGGMGGLTQRQLIDRLMEHSQEMQPIQETIARESFETIGVLGHGSFGIVTLERDTITQKLYALKALSKGYIKRENLKDHVLSEKKTLEMLSSPFCVKVHQTYRDAQYVYFLLEPALGGELYDLYNKHEELFGSADHARFYATCAALGLGHLHDRKVIYRDLKLENVLLYEDGYAVLTDFGLAKVVIGKTYTVCGTADYFAPETLRQVGHNRAVDWWAWGVMTFIMMAGRSPFDAHSAMQIYRNIVKGFKNDMFPETFSPELTHLIKSVCKKQPEQRLPMAPGGYANLEAHSWFAGMQFSMVETRKFAVPFKPPQLDFAPLKAKMEAGRPADVEFVENDESTDGGWDDDFA